MAFTALKMMDFLYTSAQMWPELNYQRICVYHDGLHGLKHVQTGCQGQCDFNDVIYEFL